MEAELKFEPAGRSGLVPTGTYLFDAARRMGVELEDECGGRGECDDCAAEIIAGAEFLSAPTRAEIEQLGEKRIAKGERLACQTKIEKPGEIVVKTKEKKKGESAEAAEEKRMADFRKEFGDLPLEKKVAHLLELEMVTLGETFNFVLNSPYKIAGKLMDVLAEFGLKQETAEKNARRPADHQDETKREAAGAETADSKKGKKKNAQTETEESVSENKDGADSPDEK